MNKKQVEAMTPDRFKRLDYAEQIEFLEVCKADYAVIKDLIRDRNEFRDLYYKLYKQLKDHGIEPFKDYFVDVKKGRHQNV